MLFWTHNTYRCTKGFAAVICSTNQWHIWGRGSESPPYLGVKKNADGRKASRAINYLEPKQDVFFSTIDSSS